MSKRLLLIGGTGYLGSHLKDVLVSLGHDVFFTGTRYSQATNYFEVDFDRPSTFKNISHTKFDFIFVLASKIRSIGTKKIGHSDFKTNVLGYGRFLDFTKEKRITDRIIYISSMTVYSPNNISPVEENAWLQPLSTYGLSKKLAEELTLFNSFNSSIKSLILRLPGIYGGRRSSGFIYNAVQKIKHGEKLIVNTKGLGYWETIHIEDLISIMVQLFSGYSWNSQSNIFNIGYGEETDICTTAVFIAEMFGAKHLVNVEDATGYDRFYMSNEKIKSLVEFEYSYYKRLRSYVNLFL